jgi:hypothetical protein
MGVVAGAVKRGPSAAQAARSITNRYWPAPSELCSSLWPVARQKASKSLGAAGSVATTSSRAPAAIPASAFLVFKIGIGQVRPEVSRVRSAVTRRAVLKYGMSFNPLGQSWRTNNPPGWGWLCRRRLEPSRAILPALAPHRAECKVPPARLRFRPGYRLGLSLAGKLAPLSGAGAPPY